MSETSRTSSPDAESSHGDKHVTPTRGEEASTVKRKGGPYVACGHYLIRCTYPFISLETFKEVGNEVLTPGPSNTSEEVFDVYVTYWKAVVGFCPLLRRQIDCGDVDMNKVVKDIGTGSRQGRSADISKLKMNTGKLLSEPGVDVTISHSKSGRGFNSDLLGRMLIPIQYLKAYDKDPVGIRAKVNAGDDDYRVTAADVPSFLYDDPLEYDSENVFAGLMRGRFLIRCLRAILLGPSKAIDGLGTSQKANRTCIAELLGVVKINVPIMVYTVILARFTITAESSWTGKDGLFDYHDFAELLFEIFEQDTDWTEETLRWWTKEIFGHEDGRKIGGVARVNATQDASSSFLAKAKVQARDRRAEKTPFEEDPFGEPTPQDRAVSPLSPLPNQEPSSHRGTPTPAPETPPPAPETPTPVRRLPPRRAAPYNPPPPPSDIYATPRPPRRAPPATPSNAGLSRGDDEEMADNRRPPDPESRREGVDSTARDDSAIAAPARTRGGRKRACQNEEQNVPAPSPPAKKTKTKARRVQA